MSWKSGRSGKSKGFSGFVSASSSTNGRGGEYQRNAKSFNTAQSSSSSSGGGVPSRSSGFSGFVKAEAAPVANATTADQDQVLQGRAKRAAAAEWQEYKTEQVRLSWRRRVVL